MSIHLTIKNEDCPNREPATPVFLSGGSSWGFCFVVGNKGSAGVKKLSKKGSVKQTNSFHGSINRKQLLQLHVCTGRIEIPWY